MSYQQLTPHAKAYRILPSEFPTLSEFLGHMFFFVGLCVGPDQEYKDHIAFMTFKRFEKVPRPLPATLLNTLFFTSIFLLIFLKLNPTFFLILCPFSKCFPPYFQGRWCHSERSVGNFQCNRKDAHLRSDFHPLSLRHQFLPQAHLQHRQIVRQESAAHLRLRHLRTNTVLSRLGDAGSTRDGRRLRRTRASRRQQGRVGSIQELRLLQD